MRRFLSILALSALCVPAVKAGNTLEDHNQLWSALQSVGVTTQTNNVECFRHPGEFDGYYHSAQRTLVVCQRGAGKLNQAVTWSENDLDTLRHEAQHVIQDCMAGDLGDNQFSPLYNDPERFRAFVSARLTETEIQNIINAYDDKSDAVIKNEIEAFAVARHVDASLLAEGVVDLCSR